MKEKCATCGHHHPDGECHGFVWPKGGRPTPCECKTFAPKPPRTLDEMFADGLRAAGFNDKPKR